MSLLERARAARSQRVNGSVDPSPQMPMHVEPQVQLSQPQQQVFHQDVQEGFIKRMLKGTLGYIIFAAVPAILVGVLLYHFKPSWIVDEETDQVKYEKVLMFAGIASAIGLAIKMMIF